MRIEVHDEAAVLALHVLKRPPHDLPANWLATPVGAAHAARIRALFELRVRERVPVVYLTNEAWLAGQRFYVDERVIVPRSYIAELLSDDTCPFLPPSSRVRAALDFICRSCHSTVRICQTRFHHLGCLGLF